MTTGFRHHKWSEEVVIGLFYKTIRYSCNLKNGWIRRKWKIFGFETITWTSRRLILKFLARSIEFSSSLHKAHYHSVIGVAMDLIVLVYFVRKSRASNEFTNSANENWLRVNQVSQRMLFDRWHGVFIYYFHMSVDIFSLDFSDTTPAVS